jgi:hypothetical protein
MRFPFTRWLVIPISAALMVSACGDTTINPDASTGGQTVTDTFPGVLLAQTVNWHQFTVQKAGPVTVVLASITPLATITIGLAIGTFDGTACTTVAGTQNDTAKVGTTIDGNAGAGTFCVGVYDVGNIVDSVEYTIRVNHS